MSIESVTADPQRAAAHSGHSQGAWRCPECGLVPRGAPWPENIATPTPETPGQPPGTARQRGAAQATPHPRCHLSATLAGVAYALRAVALDSAAPGLFGRSRRGLLRFSRPRRPLRGRQDDSAARCLSVVVAMVLLGAAGAAGCCWVLRAKTVCVCRYSGIAGTRTGLYDLCAQPVAFATTCRLVLSNVMPSEALCLLLGMLMQVDNLTPHALADVCCAIACMQGYHH